MRRYLLFRLYGPLAAWGDIAVGENRPTCDHPTKSALLGLFGAALGVRREDRPGQDGLGEGYACAMRLDAAGELLRDYHTVQVPRARKGVRYPTRRDELAAGDLYTIPPTRRDYRVESHITIAAWETATAPYTLEEVAEALRRPRFVLYLGRKACPVALPLSPAIHEAPTLRGAFAAYPVDRAFIRDLIPMAQPQYYWEELSPEEAGFSTSFVTQRRDQPLSRRRWQFRLREEHQALTQGDAP
jgi:CRISPR system Cascade subunit CasD